MGYLVLVPLQFLFHDVSVSSLPGFAEFVKFFKLPVIQLNLTVLTNACLRLILIPRVVHFGEILLPIMLWLEYRLLQLLRSKGLLCGRLHILDSPLSRAGPAAAAPAHATVVLSEGDAKLLETNLTVVLLLPQVFFYNYG